MAVAWRWRGGCEERRRDVRGGQGVVSRDGQRARDKAVLLQPAGVVRCDRPKGGDLRDHGQRPAGQVLLAVERRRGSQRDQRADARKPAVGAPCVGERVAQPQQCVARLAAGQQADWDEGGALHLRDCAAARLERLCAGRQTGFAVCVAPRRGAPV